MKQKELSAVSFLQQLFRGFLLFAFWFLCSSNFPFLLPHPSPELCCCLQGESAPPHSYWGAFFYTNKPKMTPFSLFKGPESHQILGMHLILFARQLLEDIMLSEHGFKDSDGDSHLTGWIF